MSLRYDVSTCTLTALSLTACVALSTIGGCEAEPRDGTRRAGQNCIQDSDCLARLTCRRRTCVPGSNASDVGSETDAGTEPDVSPDADDDGDAGMEPDAADDVSDAITPPFG